MTLTQNYPQLKRLPQWLTMLLVILLGITLAKLLWIFLTPEEQILTETTATQNNTSTLATPKKEQNYGKIIAGQHLFGVLEKKVVTTTKQPKQALAAEPVTVPKLNVKLYGIMAYSKKESGYALLSYNGKPQKVYAVGEGLDEKDKDKDKKVFIHKVTSEKVVINNHGKLEEFLLPKGGRELAAGAPAIAANAATTSSRQATTSSSGFIPPPPPSESRNPNVTRANFGADIKKQNNIKEDELSIDNMVDFREKIMADPSKLMEIASVRPYSKDGELIGFRVRAGKRRQLFRQLGLRNGDIVKQVNGMKLDSPEKGIMLMSELSGASELTITVLRGKREVQLPTLHF